MINLVTHPIKIFTIKIEIWHSDFFNYFGIQLMTLLIIFRDCDTKTKFCAI